METETLNPQRERGRERQRQERERERDGAKLEKGQEGKRIISIQPKWGYLRTEKIKIEKAKRETRKSS